jgi:hypothetical protein
MLQIREIAYRTEKILAKETLNSPSHRRKPVSSTSILLDSGLRRNDEFRLVQPFPSARFTRL